MEVLSNVYFLLCVWLSGLSWRMPSVGYGVWSILLRMSFVWVASSMSPNTSPAWAQRWTIVLDAIEALTCSCNQHNICTACDLKETIAKKLKEVKE